MFIFVLTSLFFVGISLFGFCVFYDQAIFNRKETIYRIQSNQKKVVLTFDDGPSPVWTPKILDALRFANIKAVFFMIGHHVKKYPQVAQRVAQEGHIIGNHGYAHSPTLYYTPAEIEEEVKYTEQVIKEITGQRTKYFRPPKAWLRESIRRKIKSMGYEIVLWSLNSKDWVSFNHKSIVKYIAKHIRNGDILLFHDSGDVFKPEGGNRTQTVKCISLLVKTLRQKGFEFVSIEDLVDQTVYSNV